MNWTQDFDNNTVGAQYSGITDTILDLADVFYIMPNDEEELPPYSTTTEDGRTLDIITNRLLDTFHSQNIYVRC